MAEEQKLSIFTLGLEGQLVEELNALQPTSLVDALIHAKAKLTSFQVGDKKQNNPFPPPSPYQPPKVSPPTSQISCPFPFVAPKALSSQPRLMLCP